MNTGIRHESGSEGFEDVLQVGVLVILGSDTGQDTRILLTVLRRYDHVFHLGQLGQQIIC